MAIQRTFMTSLLAGSIFACSNGYEYQPNVASNRQSSATKIERQVVEEDQQSELREEDERQAEEGLTEESNAAPPSETPAPVTVEDPAVLAEQGQLFFMERGCAAAFCHNQTPANDNRLVNKMATQILAAMNNPRHGNLVNNNLWPDDQQAKQLEAYFSN
ncbi:MAG: hypothetical protein ACOH5I_18295 [Oligoflexus sp.]